MRFARVLMLAATVALAGVAAPARATIDDASRAVLDHYRQVVGKTSSTIHTHSTLQAFGLTGTLDSYSQRPDKVASVTAIGPLSLREAVDGAHGWKTDPSGKVVTLDGKDLDEARGGAWFENDQWLEPDQGGGTVAFAGAKHDSSGDYHLLDLTPPTGKVRRMWFDDRTGLPMRVESKADQQQVVTTFGDWHDVAGRKFPGTIRTQIVGMAANTITATLESATLDAPIAASLFEMPGGASEPSVRWLGAQGKATLPFAYRGKHVWIRASVNGGPPADFIFDTGASITVIDSAYAAKIGLASQGHQQGQGAGATGGASFSKLETLRVTGVEGEDGIEVAGTRVAVLSVNPFLAPYFWRDAAGIIGFDVIDRFVDEIDYDKHVLVLHDPKTYTPDPKAAIIPMTLANHVPVVKMTLDGKYAGDFRVDVGSSSTVDLHTPFVKANGLAEHAGRGVDVTGGGFGGTFTNEVIRMKRVALGPFSWNDPVVSLSRATQGAFTSEDYAGNIGNRILERFKVTLDYDQRRMILVPGARYGKPDRFARAGLQLARRGETVSAMSVLAHSPAAEAGIQEGDEVLSIDGRPISQWDPDQITETLELGAVGSSHKVEYRRDGKAQVAVLKLREIL